MAKIIKEEQFICDNCKKNLTDKPHLKIYVAHDSGFMATPYTAGRPEKPFKMAAVDHHYCKPSCFVEYMQEVIESTLEIKNK